MPANKILKKKRNTKPPTLQELLQKLDKKRESDRKAQRKRYQNVKERVLLEKKMKRFQQDVAKAIRFSNQDRTALLLQFEDQSEKWGKFSLIGGKVKLQPLESFVLAYTFATSVIVSQRFLEFGISPRIVRMGYFPGASQFFTEKNLLYWRIEAPVSQRLIDGYCKLSESQAKVFRPALVLFTALLTTFLPVFPFKEFTPSFGLARIVPGSSFGLTVGEEDDLHRLTNEVTYRPNHVPKKPEEDEDEEEEDYGDLFGSEDERSTDGSDEVESSNEEETSDETESSDEAATSDEDDKYLF